jgi:hypothetical protein
MMCPPVSFMYSDQVRALAKSTSVQMSVVGCSLSNSRQAVFGRHRVEIALEVSYGHLGAMVTN